VSIIGNFLLFTTNDLCKLLQKLKEFSCSCGPIARLWIGPILLVALTDPDAIENLVKHYKFLSRWLLGIEGDIWRRHRKIVEKFAKNSDILANKLKALADGITAHDIAAYLVRCTLDIIVQTSSRLMIPHWTTWKR
jgi:hypothetical protein